MSKRGGGDRRPSFPPFSSPSSPPPLENGNSATAERCYSFFFFFVLTDGIQEKKIDKFVTTAPIYFRHILISEIPKKITQYFVAKNANPNFKIKILYSFFW